MHWEVNNRNKAEDYILKALRKFKINNEGGGKEWFKLTIEEAKQKVSKLIKEYEKNMAILMSHLNLAEVLNN
tara:strand:- start:256 stop:471 length:216 start_codon:yes stop_codon:yes gene_type:complete